MATTKNPPPKDLYPLEATTIYGILAKTGIHPSKIEIHNRNEIAPYELDLLVRVSSDVRVGIEVQDLRTHTAFNQFKAEKCKARGIIYCEVWENNLEADIEKAVEEVLKAIEWAKKISQLSKENYEGKFNKRDSSTAKKQVKKTAKKTTRKTKTVTKASTKTAKATTKTRTRKTTKSTKPNN